MAGTKRIKIAVCISEHGGWEANGSDLAADDELLDSVLLLHADVGGNIALYWIEAEVPIPDPIPAITAGVERV